MFTVFALYILLCAFVFLCVSCKLPLLVRMCVCVVIWQIGACVCVGQMPFPPEYLAPPAERMKKERKTKTPKNKKETPGKVREELGRIKCSENMKQIYCLLMNTHNSHTLPMDVPWTSIFTVYMLYTVPRHDLCQPLYSHIHGVDNLVQK